MRRQHLVAVSALTALLACQPSLTPPEPAQDASDTRHDAPTPDASAGLGAGEDADLTDVDRADADAGPDTRAQLDAFWSANGGRDAFSPLQLDAVEAMLLAEDDVLAGRYAEARARIDAVFTAYPASDPVWWSAPVPLGLNLGTPVAYYGLRMLDEIARVGAAEGVASLGALQLTVVRVACATGRRPSSADLSEGEDVSLTLDPALQDRAIIDASFSLFRAYVRAITGGRLTLDVEVVDVAECATVTFDPSSRVSSIQDAAASVRRVPEAIRRATDMWLVTYPSNVPPGPEFEGAEFVTGGMGAFGDAPLFIADDLWIVRKPPHLGDGPYSEVERRVYLPQWVQHEFFHHLFRRYPEFGLEARGHQWFDRGTWPDDFVGQWEPDYYAEAVSKRLAAASPPLHDALRVASRHVDTTRFSIDDLLGSYARSPVENGYHEVTVTRSGDALTWSNAAGVSWSMTWEDGVLRTGEDCPYGAQEVALRVRFGPGEDLTLEGLVFLGELYAIRP